MIKVKSNPFMYLRFFSELNAPNLYLSAKIIMPELLITDKQIPIKIPNIKPIKPMEHRINPNINPNTKYKSLLVLIETHFFIICNEAPYLIWANNIFVYCKLYQGQHKTACRNF